VLPHQGLDLVQLIRTKSEIPGERDWRKPEFGGLVISVDMNMRRFVRFVTVKVDPVRPAAKYCRSHQLFPSAQFNRLTGVARPNGPSSADRTRRG
jgi:hypothetical protein